MIGNRNAVLYIIIASSRFEYMGVLYFTDDYRPLLFYGQMQYCDEYDESIKTKDPQLSIYFGSSDNEKRQLKEKKCYKRLLLEPNEYIFKPTYRPLWNGCGIMVNDSLYEGYWEDTIKAIPFKFVKDTSPNIVRTHRTDFNKVYKVRDNKWIEIDKNADKYDAALYFSIPTIINDTNLNTTVLSLFSPNDNKLSETFTLKDIHRLKHLYFDTFRIGVVNTLYSNVSIAKFGEVIYQDDDFLGVFSDDCIWFTQLKKEVIKKEPRLYTINLHTNKILYFNDIFQMGSEREIMDIVIKKYNNPVRVKNLNIHNFMLTKKGIFFLYELEPNTDKPYYPVEVFLTYEEVKQFMKK